MRKAVMVNMPAQIRKRKTQRVSKSPVPSVFAALAGLKYTRSWQAIGRGRNTKKTTPGKKLKQ